MGEKSTFQAAQTAVREQTTAVQTKPEPARKISPVWTSDDANKTVIHACTKCASRGSSH